MKNSYIDFRLIAKVLGSLIIIVGFSMLVPAIISLIYGAVDFFAIIGSLIISVFIGLFFRYGIGKSVKKGQTYLHKREGYLIVVLAWIAVSIFGALPFIIDHTINTYSEAFFEAISGFTTTGVSTMTNIESMPKGLLFWRSQTQWMGGLGIIVFILAVLPLMGISGGNNLFSAEVTGPTKDKIHPRVSTTAKILVIIYVCLTLLEAFFLTLGEMDFFDAICHSFSTVATGGFSTKNDSLMGYAPYTQYVVTVFMFLSGINFALYYFAVTGRLQRIRKNSELKAYTLFTLFSVLFLTLVLFFSNYESFTHALRDGAFMSISMITTTGFVASDYSLWMPATHFFIFILLFTGACAGSSSGGIKIVRHTLLLKNMNVEFRRAIHPRAVIPVKYNGNTVSPEIISRVLAFFFMYILIVVISSIIFSLLGFNFEVSLSITSSALANSGIIIGDACATCGYENVPMLGKWLLALLMVIGRLELFTVLILFTPVFWKK